MTDGRDLAAYDVVMVGGAAGPGDALTLARARRSVLVVDGGLTPAGGIFSTASP